MHPGRARAVDGLGTFTLAPATVLVTRLQAVGSQDNALPWAPLPVRCAPSP